MIPPLNVTIALATTTYTLDTVEVTDEDPAVNIMRRVIAKKQQWREGLKTYRAEAYTRFMLYRRDDLVHMRETISEAYWKPDGGSREVVIAKRRKPPRAKNFRFAGPSHVPNFYDDDVDLYGFTFIGPTHPDALNAYTFRMGENQTLDNRLVYEIYLSPRTALNSTFAGRLLILADEYVILEAHLRPNWFALRPPPILSWQVSYAQQFAPTPENYWLPVDLRLQGQVTFGRTGVSYAPARFEQLSRLTLHVPNVPVPDSLFANSRRIYELPFSEARTHLFRWNPGMVPLTARETEAIDNIHPRLTLRAAFWPTGLLSQYAAVQLEEEPPCWPYQTRTRPHHPLQYPRLVQPGRWFTPRCTARPGPQPEPACRGGRRVCPRPRSPNGPRHPDLHDGRAQRHRNALRPRFPASRLCPGCPAPVPLGHVFPRFQYHPHLPRLPGLFRLL